RRRQTEQLDARVRPDFVRAHGAVGRSRDGLRSSRSRAALPRKAREARRPRRHRRHVCDRPSQTGQLLRDAARVRNVGAARRDRGRGDGGDAVRRANRAIASMVVVFAGAACSADAKPGYEYMPDMARGAAYKAFAPNAATRDGLTLQRPVAGTVARGQRPFHYGPGEQEAMRAARELVDPFRATPATL